jgi:hypothetical protein
MINLKKQFTTTQFRKFVGNEGKLFSVTFKKKDGSLRTMTARLGVRKYLTGGGSKFDAEANGMVRVFSMGDLGYRTVTAEKIIKLKAYGRVLNLQ